MVSRLVPHCMHCRKVWCYDGPNVFNIKFTNIAFGQSVSWDNIDTCVQLDSENLNLETSNYVIKLFERVGYIIERHKRCCEAFEFPFKKPSAVDNIYRRSGGRCRKDWCMALTAVYILSFLLKCQSVKTFVNSVITSFNAVSCLTVNKSDLFVNEYDISYPILDKLPCLCEHFKDFESTDCKNFLQYFAQYIEYFERDMPVWSPYSNNGLTLLSRDNFQHFH